MGSRKQQAITRGSCGRPLTWAQAAPSQRAHPAASAPCALDSLPVGSCVHAPASVANCCTLIIMTSSLFAAATAPEAALDGCPAIRANTSYCRRAVLQCMHCWHRPAALQLGSCRAAAGCMGSCHDRLTCGARQCRRLQPDCLTTALAGRGASPFGCCRAAQSSGSIIQGRSACMAGAPSWTRWAHIFCGNLNTQQPYWVQCAIESQPGVHPDTLHAATLVSSRSRTSNRSANLSNMLRRADARAPSRSIHC